MWMGAATVELPGAGERGSDVGAESEPVEYAWEATACSRAEARAGLGDADAACWRAAGLGAGGGVGAAPGVGRRNIASIVGRRAAPKGVERKSEGRSVFVYEIIETSMIESVHTLYPRGYRSSCEEPNAIIRERVAVEV